MLKKSFLFVLCALMMTSCHFRHIMSEEEFDALDKATFDFDIDWSEMEEKPSGVTIYLFPCEENPLDPTIQVRHSNNVNRVRVVVPDQDYSVICFNQSESEFAALKFNFKSYNEAIVQAKSAEETSGAVVRYGKDGTRAYNNNLSLRPSSIATGSKPAIKKSTRAYNNNLSLRPHPPIKGLSISVHVFGLNNGVSVKGKLTNLSSGVTLHNQKPLLERLDQSLDEDHWDIALPQSDSVPGTVTCSFGTFGIPLDDDNLFPTRGLIEPNVRNMLQMDFRLPDGTHAIFEKDVTELIESEFRRLLQGEETGSGSGSGGMSFELGSGSDPDGSNSEPEDGETPSGTLVIHKTQTGTVVSVTNWNDTIINIVL